jgi:hypothetical protein
MKSSRARNSQDKENKRNIIMDSAIELFLTSSGKIPSATQVAKLSNMTKGNLYTYFKSKEELFFDLLIEQYKNWFNEAQSLGDYSFKLETRLFEGFYNNELHVKLCSLYHSGLKHSLSEKQKEFIEKLVRDQLDKLTIPISNASILSKSEIQILLYSSISLIIGAYHFEHEYEDGFNALTPQDIYLPRLKVMWSIF